MSSPVPVTSLAELYQAVQNAFKEDAPDEIRVVGSDESAPVVYSE